MAKIWFDPQSTETEPAGDMEPWAPALAKIDFVSTAKLAAMVWLAVTFAKLYLLTGPTEAPSTSTSAMWWQAPGVIVKVWLEPQSTETEPDGETAPPAPALAVMVSTPTAKLAAMVWLA